MWFIAKKKNEKFRDLYKNSLEPEQVKYEPAQKAVEESKYYGEKGKRC